MEKQRTIEEKITAEIESAIQDDRENLTMFNMVRQVVARYAGKKPTAHIKTRLQKEHPDLTVYFSWEHGRCRLCIWGGDSGREYNRRFDFTLAYTQPSSYKSVIDMDDFDHINACYGSAAEERIDKLTHILSGGGVEEISRKADAILKATADWKELSHHSKNPAIYRIEKTLGI